MVDEIEKKVLENVKSDFFTKTQLISDPNDAFSTFEIQEGLNMKDLLQKFKVQVKNWGKNKYGSIHKTEEKLGLKPGTMKNYK